MGESCYYHFISRTVGQEYYLGDTEKERLLNIIKFYSGMYLVKVIGFCVMSNHFHLLIQSKPEHLYSDKNIANRIERYMPKLAESNIEDEVKIARGRAKFGDISEYMRSIKQTFSRWYNKTNHRTGYFWGDRFKSIWLQDGESLLSCLAYIDLNPVRAKIVKIPEDYRWCGLSYRVCGYNANGFLSFDGVFEEADEKPESLLVRNYRYLVYRWGNIERVTLSDIESGKTTDTQPKISDEIYLKELDRRFRIPAPELLSKRVRYFSDGLVVGSKIFIKNAYARFGKDIILKKDRRAHKIPLSDSLYTLRQIKLSSP
jgi:REP element-mobilizing transposase RayT